METYPLRLDDAHIVIAGLETLAEGMRSQPGPSEDATSLLLEGASDVDRLAADIRDWMTRRLGLTD